VEDLKEVSFVVMKLRRFRLALIFASVSLLCIPSLPSRASAAADEPDEEPRRKDAPVAARPFEPTEQLVYEAEFSRLLLRGIKIAEFKFTATRANLPETTAANPPVSLPASQSSPAAAASPLLLVGDIESKGWFRKLFGINFHFRVESTVEPESFAVLRTIKLDEQGKRVRTSEAVFDRAGNKIAWTERDPNDPRREPRVVTNDLGGAMHDVVSAIYFLRTQQLTPGKTFNLVLSDSGRVYHVPATVLAEKKKMKSPLGRVSVVRVDVGLFGEGRPVEGKGQMSMWVTNDARRLPVRARMSSDLGTLDISLKNIKTK
jgi:hypothetical protein